MARKAKQVVAEQPLNPTPKTKTRSRKLSVSARIWGPKKGFSARVNRKVVFEKSLEPLRRIAGELGRPGIAVKYVG